MSNRVIHFEIHADEPQRAINFYSTVFGWQVNKWAGPVDYWLVTTGSEDQAGINGAIMARQGVMPAPDAALTAYACTIDVADLDEKIAQVTANGGQVVVEKMAVPQVGWMCYCKDPEGNIFGMMQADEAAQ